MSSNIEETQEEPTLITIPTESTSSSPLPSETISPIDSLPDTTSSIASPIVPIDETDSRKQYDYRSKYPKGVSKEISYEAVFLFSVLFFSLFMLFATWKGWTCDWLGSHGNLTLRRYGIYASSGMLGGIVFGLKYFYRVVARGYWHQDRRYWRIMSPFIAMVVSIVIGALVDASFLPTNKPVSGSSFLSIGFIAGYFADEAVGKMYEIASVVFGKNTLAHDGKETPKDGQNK